MEEKQWELRGPGRERSRGEWVSQATLAHEQRADRRSHSENPLVPAQALQPAGELEGKSQLPSGRVRREEEKSGVTGC